MAEFTDPFTRVYQAIRNGMIAWHGITEILTKGSTLRLRDFTDFSDPQVRNKPPSEAPNDYPDFYLDLGQFHLDAYGNSRAAKFGQSYRLFISNQFYSIVNPGLVKIHTLAALTNLGLDLGLPGLVVGWNITSGSDELQSFVRPHNGWTTVLSINVEMAMSRNDLLAI